MTSQARCIICNLKSQIKACEAALADCEAVSAAIVSNPIPEPEAATDPEPED